MGFNKLYIPEVSVLQAEMELEGRDVFYKKWCRRYVKADAIFGPEESLDFIKQFLANEYDM